MFADERFRRAGWLVVILAALTSPAQAADNGTRRADEPPAGVSASDWQGIRAAHNAARQAAFVAEEGFLTGIDPLEQQAYLKASNTDADDGGGGRVA